MKLIAHSGAKFSYKFGYRRNGVDYWPLPEVANLILDSGLNKIASNAWQTCWEYCLFGNQVSPEPVQRTSGAITFTVVGTTCTASGNFFVSQDTGRLIKFNDVNGQEFYLTYVSATVATLSGTPSPGIVAETGKIWYVNQTALQSLYSTTNAYDSAGGANGTSAIDNVVTYKRTFVGGAVSGGPITFTEIGFSNSGSNANIFDRDIITGGITLVDGDIPLAVATLIITFGTTTQDAVGNVATGYDSSGTKVISGMRYATSVGSLIGFVNGNGTTGGSPSNDQWEPAFAASAQFYCLMADFTLPAFSNGLGVSLGSGTGGDVAATIASYSNGSFYRDCVFAFSISAANGLIYGFGQGVNPGLLVWMLKLTTPFTKLSSQTLTFTFRKTWQRILLN